MTRARRSEIIRRTTSYVAAVVETLPLVDGGLWEGLSDDQAEAILVEATVLRLADSIRSRIRR